MGAAYSENNLVRCAYSGLPPDATDIQVQVIAVSSDSTSNIISFPLYGQGTGLDLTSPMSYAKALRYQCQDAIFIPNALDGNVYDPFLSESPDLSYPLNFYTTNIALALMKFVTSSATKPQNGVGWLCPNNPSQLLNELIFSQNEQNRIISGQPPVITTPQLKRQIWPPIPENDFDRQTFYLAKAPMGQFRVAFNTFVAPKIATQIPNPKQTNTADALPPPIGYAVAPMRVGNGEEKCPIEAVNVPAGYTWVKIWQFRASLAPRTYKASLNLSSAKIACAPGKTPSGEDIFTDCKPGGGFPLPPAEGWFIGESLLDRIDQRSSCFGVGYQRAQDVCAQIPAEFDKVGMGCASRLASEFVLYDKLSVFADGTDAWQPWRRDARIPACSPAVTPSQGDFMRLCDASFIPAGHPVFSIPHDDELVALDSIDNGVSRYDFVYMVSPPEIMSKDFGTNSQSSSGPGAPYHPFRCYNKQDCITYKNNPTALPTNKRISYEFISWDVSQVERPSNLPPQFPLCALQPKGGGQ